MAKTANKSRKSSKSSAKSNGQTPKQRETLAKKVAKLKGQGQGWSEIIDATGVKGPATARKLLKEFGLDKGVVRERKSGGRKRGKTGDDDGGETKRSSRRGKSKTSRNRRSKGKGKTSPSS